MAGALTIGAGYLAVLLMLGAVVGTVERRERYVFVVGVGLLLVSLTFLRGISGATVAVVGVAAVVAATVPMLREPAPST